MKIKDMGVLDPQIIILSFIMRTHMMDDQKLKTAGTISKEKDIFK